MGLLAHASISARSCIRTVGVMRERRWNQVAAPRKGEGETVVRTSLLEEADPPDARARGVSPRVGVGAQECAPAKGLTGE